MSSPKRTGTIAALAAVAAAGVTAATLLVGAGGGETAARPLDLSEYALGDQNITNPAGDAPDTWFRTWDCKETGCAPGESKRVSGAECRSGFCQRLSILSPDTNAGNSHGGRDSVGIVDWHTNSGPDGDGDGGVRDGTIATYQWSFKLGQGFPSPSNETRFINLTEVHATGFNAPGHPLTVNANGGSINTSSYGWDPVRGQNGGNGWSCQLAPTQKTGVWYRVSVHAHWNDVDGYLRVRLDDPTTGPGWDKTCVRDDGQGTLFRDPDGSVNQGYFAQNLYRAGVYTQPMTVWYDDFRQSCSLDEHVPGECGGGTPSTTTAPATTTQPPPTTSTAPTTTGTTTGETICLDPDPSEPFITDDGRSIETAAEFRGHVEKNLGENWFAYLDAHPDAAAWIANRKIWAEAGQPDVVCEDGGGTTTEPPPPTTTEPPPTSTGEQPYDPACAPTCDETIASLEDAVAAARAERDAVAADLDAERLRAATLQAKLDRIGAILAES